LRRPRPYRTILDMVPSIPGLRYLPEYLDVATHDRLWAGAESAHWLSSAGRGVQIYGYSYDHHQRRVYRVGELPSWATDVAVRLSHDGLIQGLPDQIVVNDYPPGAGIFEHVDADILGDTVISLSLGSGCVIRFREQGSGRREELLLERFSALGAYCRCPI
jgi:alkylated DNA repair dioxygenase AlkB